MDKKIKRFVQTTIQKTLDGMLRGLFGVQRILSLNAAPFSWAEVGPRSVPKTKRCFQNPVISGTKKTNQHGDIPFKSENLGLQPKIELP